MKISGKVTFHVGETQHNQATLEGASMIADILAGRILKNITNCFMITDLSAINIGVSPIDLTWDTLRPYLVGNKLYASPTGINEDNKFGYMTVAAEGIVENAAKLTCTVFFPANQGAVASGIVYYLVLVAGGNAAPYSAGGYEPVGSEAVMAVVDMSANPISFTPNTDNNFTWTIYLTPDTE